MNESYMIQVLWYISWPVIIYFSYKVISLAMNVFEKKQAK
jgi:hypothetical protein